MISAKELKDWAATLRDDTGVAIDDGGLRLVEVDATAHPEPAWLEVGGIPEDEAPGDRPRYEVVAGNIGYVYTGDSVAEAESHYGGYVRMSRDGYGKAAGESVTLL